MKNTFKIWALSLALIASIFLLSNTTKASDVTLQITGNEGYCVVGSSVPYGATGFSYSAYSIQTGFASASGNTWLCNDSNGKGPWTVDLSSTAVANITTNDAGHTIANSRLHVTNDAATMVAGACTANVGTSQSVAQPLSGTVVLFGKTGNTGDVCVIETNNVKMTIDLNASQALGQYSGTLTITVPTL